MLSFFMNMFALTQNTLSEDQKANAVSSVPPLLEVSVVKGVGSSVTCSLSLRSWAIASFLVVS